MFKAQHILAIITPVVGYNFKTPLIYSAQFPLPREHSLSSCLSWRYRQIHTQHILHILYRVPIYTPGWRAAMWIKCLAERQKCQALTGIEPATSLIQSQGFNPIYHDTSTYIYLEILYKILNGNGICVF